MPSIPRRSLDAVTALDQEPLLVAQHGREPPEPLQGLDIIVTHVTSVAEQSGCCKRNHGHHRVHSGNEQRFVPSQVAQRFMALPEVL